jgi:FxsC-like protein
MSENEKNKSAPWFFMSYARRDAKNNLWVEQFYKRLADEVWRKAQLEGNPNPSEIGFFDQYGIEVGDKWEARLANALQTSKVFLCLYSRSYFSSDFCGKEFQVFSDRVAAYEKSLAKASSAPRLIIPILWENPTELPAKLPGSVPSLQYTNTRNFGQMYADEGLLYIVRLEEGRDYERCLISLAKIIVEEAAVHPLPPLPNLPPIQQVKAAFPEPLTIQPSPPLSPAPRQEEENGESPVVAPDSAADEGGPEVAWFVYVAGRASDYHGIRQTVDGYGKSGGYDWRPYYPPINTQIGAIVANVVGGKKITPMIRPLTDQLITDLQKAEDENTIVIIVVDPWSIQLPTYQGPMSAYDRTRLENCGVIIIWNEKDTETAQKKEVLREQITKTFSRNLISKDIFFQDSVSSEDELREKLCAAIDEVQKRIVDRGKLLRRVDAARSGSTPKLQGPV